MTLRAHEWTLLLIGLIILSMAPSAKAEDMTFGENGFARLDVGKTYVNLPSESAVITFFLAPFGETENSFWGEHVEVTGGLWLPGTDTVSEDRTRLEASVNYLAADATSRATTDIWLGFYDIDGSGFGGGPIGTVNTAVMGTSYKQWGLDLKLAREMAVAGVESLTLYAGLTYFNTSLSNDFDLVIDGSPSWPYHLEDEIDTDYYGLMVGVDAAVPLGSKLIFDMGGRLALLYADAQMDAYQFFSLSVDDSEDKIAGRAEAHLGLRYDLSPIVFGIGASASYLSYQPYAEHPNSSATALIPSHIEDDDMFSCRVNVSMTVAF